MALSPDRAKELKDREAAKKGGLGGGAGVGSGERGTLSQQQDRKNIADRAKANKAGEASQRVGAVPPDQLPPGVNPAKYENKPTQSFAPTASNLAGVAAQVAGTLTNPAVGAVYTGVKALTDEDYDPLNPFEKPEGLVGGAGTYEGSEPENVSQLSQSELAPPKPKKKKNDLLSKIGTLLADAGGTLVAG